MNNLKRSLFCALDFKDPRDAHNLIEKVREYIDGVKVGLEFFVANGPIEVIKLKKYDLPIFLDLKLHDIPNTVSEAVKSVMKIKPDLLSIHITGGKQMLKEVTSLRKRPKIVGISLLTSLEKQDLRQMGINLSPENYVKKLAKIAIKLKLDGIVSSALEAKLIRSICPKKFIIITPGIRLGSNNLADQKRVATPRQAIENGASTLIVGRPITKSKNPGNVAKKIKNIIENI
tara:strand:+ start:490 stop:1182 length:693 start_codon:yes stop_codon:yes gene_type:complete